MDESIRWEMRLTSGIAILFSKLSNNVKWSDFHSSIYGRYLECILYITSCNKLDDYG